MKHKLPFLIAISCVFWFGCSKNNSSPGAAAALSNGMKLYRIYAGGQLQAENSYTSAGQLQKHAVYRMPGRKISETNCSYSTDGKLIKKEDSFDFSSGPTPAWSYSYTEYSYATDGRIDEERTYRQQGSSYILVSKTKLLYDANSRLISRKLSLPNDNPVSFTNYQYNSRGNIFLQEDYRYNGPTPEIQFRYSFDNFDGKLNPLRGLHCEAPPYSVNQNNVLQMTVTNFVITPGTPVTTVSNTVYNSYNSGGLPVAVFENGTNFTYEYH